MRPLYNELLQALPGDDRAAVMDDCEAVELAIAEVLCERRQSSAFAYFPTGVVISHISMADGRAGVELGMTGSEGMLGVHLMLGVDEAPLRAVVQSAGPALRLSARAFSAHLDRRPALRALVSRYLFVLNAQQATSAACLRFHQVDQRLARWLLMSQDRIHGRAIPMTQEFLAYLLGVRKLGTSIATSALLRDGVIDYRAGLVEVLSREGLRAATCSCYASDESVRRSILPFLLAHDHADGND